MPHPVDNPMCERHINNMKDFIFHEDSISNDQTIVVAQLPESHLSDENPGLEQSEVKLQQLIDLSPQLNLDMG